MLSRLVHRRKIAGLVRVVDEMCREALHLKAAAGLPLPAYFRRHPMLSDHHPPFAFEQDQVHQFMLANEQVFMSVLVSDGATPYVSVAPSGPFEGAHIQSGKAGRYIVRVEAPISRAVGSLAEPFVREFMARHGAMRVRG